MDIKLIVSDLDGTLFNSDLEGYRISDELKMYINVLRESGVMFTIATGRPLASSINVVQELEIDIPYIAYNGAQIINPNGSIVYDNSFALKEWLPFIKRILSLGETVLFYKDGKPHYFTYTRAIDVYEKKEYIKCLRSNIEEIDVDTKVNKILLIGDTRIFLNEWEALNDNLKLECTPLKSEHNYIELIKSDVSKGSGIRFLKRHLGIEEGYIVGIGNHMNDKELLLESTIGYAVKNAEEELKKIADFVTESEYEQGVIEIIKKYLKPTEVEKC